MNVLDRLRAEGLEHLGDLKLSSTVVIGDPKLLAQAPGPQWIGLGTVPGGHVVLGRAWTGDADLLEEIVLVSKAVLAEDRADRFWDLYDEARDAGTVPLASGRVAVLDGALRTESATLRSLVEPDELPWVLDRGVVAEAIRFGPARVFVGGGSVAELVSVALGPAPREMARSSPAVQSDGFPDPDEA
jgi:hypothetical protein